MKISIDYDETLTTARGMELAKRLIDEGNTIYIISARHNKEPMLKRADELGIPHDRIYATGSNKAKIEKIKELGMEKHYDNNKDVVKELGDIGYQFDNQFEKFNLVKESFKIIYGNTRTRNNSIKSSNVWKFKWNDENGELVVKFQDGSVYTYSNVSKNDFEKFANGTGGVCNTSGSNKWGVWEVGKTPSVGAAVWDVLMKYSYKKGGKID